MITDLRSFLKVSCDTKFRFAERKAQCILGECGPLMVLTCIGEMVILLATFMTSPPAVPLPKMNHYF